MNILKLMKNPVSVANVDFSKLSQEKPVGKYGNLKNYLKEKGVDVDDATLDKKMRSFFEDMITEILKNPDDWNRTRNINFMALFEYLSGKDMQDDQTSNDISIGRNV